MATIESSRQKSAVEYLNFGAKTSKRVTWESWEFTIEAPHLVRVTNASYGCEKDNHSYLVGVEDRDGVLVPAECECPADMYNEEYDCKHKVALAAVGGAVVLDAAAAFSHQSTEGDESILAGECDCTTLSDLPCWPCYRKGVRA